MQDFKCIIIDDEPAAVRLLERYISDVSFLTLRNGFTKPLKALSFLETNTIDLLFLDIQMPQITGLQLSKIISPSTSIIFTTAYPEFALESYDVSAVDYLLKPFSFERFYKAVLKVKSNNITTQKASKSDDYLFVKTDGKHNFTKVDIDTIMYIEGLKNYVSIQLKDSQIITYNTLKYLTERLPHTHFIQVHKSYIINLDQIEKIENDAIWINMNQLPIGNTFRSAFFEAINNRQL